MDKLAKHGHQANKAALYGELCALLFAKSHYDEVGFPFLFLHKISFQTKTFSNLFLFNHNR